MERRATPQLSTQQDFVYECWPPSPNSFREAPGFRHGEELKIDTLYLEGIYPQKVMRFSQLIFGPRNVPQMEQNIVSFGLNSSSRRGKDGQRSMNEGLLYSPKSANSIDVR